MELADNYRTFYIIATGYPFFSNAHGIIFRIYFMADHLKKSLIKFVKIEFTLSNFSDCNGMKAENSNRRKTGHFTNMWRLSNMFLNKTQRVKDEIQRKSRNTLKHMKMEAQYRKQYLQHAEKIVLRKKFIATNTYIKKWEKPQINNLNLQLKYLK